MSSTDWRALCEELAGWIERSTRHYLQDPEVLIRAREALAQPEPEVVGPTRDELWELWLRLNNELPDKPAAVAEFWEHAQVDARARWGRPAPAPAGERQAAVVGEPSDAGLLHPAYEPGDGSADGAQMVGMAWWHPVMGCDSLQIVVDNARAVLTRWGNLKAGLTSSAPVPAEPEISAEEAAMIAAPWSYLAPPPARPGEVAEGNDHSADASKMVGEDAARRNRRRYPLVQSTGSTH